MKLLRWFIAAAGALCVLSAAIGVSRGAGWWALAPMLVALVLVSWLVLIYRRARAGWYLGCVVFGALFIQVSVFQALLPFVAEPGTAFGWWMLISQSILALLILLLLAKWWIPRKHEFTTAI